jgi:hypothetical protein
MAQRRAVAALYAEETSGSIVRRRRRTTFERFYDVAHDRVRDPWPGQPIRAIVCFNYDRFTREPDEGGRWVRLLLSKSIDLYETQPNDPPRALYLSEPDIRKAWVDAQREITVLRGRIMDRFLQEVRRGERLYGCELFGRERILDPERAPRPCAPRGHMPSVAGSGLGGSS